MTKRISLIIALLLTVATPVSAQQFSLDDDTFHQHLSWGITVSPTLTGWRHNLDTLSSAPSQIRTALGVDAGFFFNFHVTPVWNLIFGGNFALEQISLKNNNNSDHLLSLGTDIDFLLAYNIPTNSFCWQLALGPYTHFMHLDLSANPSKHSFSRTFAFDNRNGEPYFLLGDFNAGLTFQASIFKQNGTSQNKQSHKWHYFCKLRWGITDILNVDSHRLYVRPYKIAVGVACHF